MCKLTVIMSTFNESSKELDQSINSILNQTFSDFSFIIIDDNPKSVKLRKHLLIIADKDRRIHLLFNRYNIGLVKSLNRGIKYSHSKLIARMDADDISLKNRFTNQINFMDRYDLDFVFPNGKVIRNKRLSKNAVFYNYYIINQKLLKYLFSHYYNFAIHSGWMLKRDIYIKLGGYRQINAAEDLDFLIRSLIYHYRIGYQPQVLIYRRCRNIGVSSTNTLQQFISALILRRYVRKNKYYDVLSIKSFNKSMNKYISKKGNKKFNLFLYFGHKIKYHFHLLYLLKFIFVLFSSINSIRFLLGVFSHPIENVIMYYMIIKYSK